MEQKLKFKAAQTALFTFIREENSLVMIRKSDQHVIENTSICVRELQGAVRSNSVVSVTPDFLDEYLELCDDLGTDPSEEVVSEARFLQAKEKAIQISEDQGVVQHVNKTAEGEFYVSDWYDCDSTVATIEPVYGLCGSKNN